MWDEGRARVCTWVVFSKIGHVKKSSNIVAAGGADSGEGSDVEGSEVVEGDGGVDALSLIGRANALPFGIRDAEGDDLKRLGTFEAIVSAGRVGALWTGMRWHKRRHGRAEGGLDMKANILIAAADTIAVQSITAQRGGKQEQRTAINNGRGSKRS